MQKSNKKTPFVFYLGIVLLTLVMFSTHFMSGLYARYTTTASGGDSARVARFEVSEIISKNGVSSLFTVGETLKPGESTVYKFEVTNNSEVAVKYTVKGDNLTKNLPLILDTVSGEIAPNSTKTITFYIEWKADNSDPKYIGMVDYITITVTAEQID